MNDKFKLAILGLAAAGLVLAFLFTDLGTQWEYALTLRGRKLAAMLLTGAAIAFSTVVFQTITNNRILTPSIIGLDSLYMLIQTAIVFLFGSFTLASMNSMVHFFLSSGLMVLFAGVLYKLLFRGESRHIYFLLLVGIVCGTFFSNISSFLQMLIDPNEYLVVQDRMFASINNVNADILWIAALIFAAIALYSMRDMRYLDVISLGREEAINLGVRYDFTVKRCLIIVAVLISVATALVGPITFLGLIVANVAYQVIRTYRHSLVIPGAILISIIALVGGQWIVERVFTFSTSLSVIINFIGGVYFITLILKGNRS